MFRQSPSFLLLEKTEKRFFLLSIFILFYRFCLCNGLRLGVVFRMPLLALLYGTQLLLNKANYILQALGEMSKVLFVKEQFVLFKLWELIISLTLLALCDAEIQVLISCLANIQIVDTLACFH